jgi:hypothetical protein
MRYYKYTQHTPRTLLSKGLCVPSEGTVSHSVRRTDTLIDSSRECRTSGTGTEILFGASAPFILESSRINETIVFHPRLLFR